MSILSMVEVSLFLLSLFRSLFDRSLLKYFHDKMIRFLNKNRNTTKVIKSQDQSNTVESTSGEIEKRIRNLEEENRFIKDLLMTVLPPDKKLLLLTHNSRLSQSLVGTDENLTISNVESNKEEYSDHSKQVKLEHI